MIERNFHCNWGEIDIVAYRNGNLTFVEVQARQRNTLGSASESVTLRKQQHLLASTQEYPQQHQLEHHPWRIDILDVRLGPGDGVISMEHLANRVIEF